MEEILPAFTKTLLIKEGIVFANGEISKLISCEMLTEFFHLPVHVDWKNARPMLSKIQVGKKESLETY